MVSLEFQEIEGGKKMDSVERLLFRESMKIANFLAEKNMIF